MNSDSLNMVSRLGEGHMPCNFFLSEPQLKTTVNRPWHSSFLDSNQVGDFPRGGLGRLAQSGHLNCPILSPLCTQSNAVYVCI